MRKRQSGKTAEQQMSGGGGDGSWPIATARQESREPRMAPNIAGRRVGTGFHSGNICDLRICHLEI